MPWNGSGTYSPPAASFPEVNGTVIDAGRYNPTINDLAAGITNCLAKDGQNSPTANIPMGGYKLTGAAVGASAGEPLTWGQTLVAAVGSAAAPSVTFDGDSDSGVYRVGADQVGVAINGVNHSTFKSREFRLGASNGRGALGMGGAGLTGVGTITTAIPYGAAATSGGGLLIVSGADLTGQSFCAVYVVATRLPAGGTTGAAVLLSRAGSSSPTLVVNVASAGDGVVTIDVSGAASNITYAFGIGF